MPRTIDWAGDHLVAIDQTLLPDELALVPLRTVDDVIDALRRLVVRGAPAIGVAGGLGVALAAVVARRDGHDDDWVRAEAARVRAARPTAVNLAWGVDRVLAHLDSGVDTVVSVAVDMLDEDVATNRALAVRGAEHVRSLVPDPRRVRVLTHCNAGGLACVEWGTALGIVRALHEDGDLLEVFADETRPLLQGARLTAWELSRMGVPHRVVVDGAGATVIARGLVDVVIVGADRIAADGDVANKIGTYPLALAAARAGIPFVVAAPESTLDPHTASGADILIEARDPDEVLVWRGQRLAPPESSALNLAFDVTPADLVTALVTEARVVRLSAGERLTD
ncbi:MAG: S-methyl-5-thioribose-1-phosphate isomerase [Actinobacteria bacterium]|nr:S-methyl-5-thioribose-1-phosphate isomerase [Actinomycetota bacterium]